MKRFPSIVLSVLALGVSALVLTGVLPAAPKQTHYAVDAIPTMHNEVKHAENQTSGASTSDDLLHYYGGTVLKSSPKIYLVFWGKQWSKDPAGVAPRLQSFLGGLYGATDTWSKTVTQYCQGAPIGATDCSTKGVKKIGHATKSPLLGVWFDNAANAPSQPNQEQLGNEAIRAAQYFGNTKAAKNASAQYMIVTSQGNNSAGFGTQYCAWHSNVSSSYGNLAYVNVPYIPDADWACGAGFVNPGTAGALDGVTMVVGHEFVETLTDPMPISGWHDVNTNEVADKCIWITPGQTGGAINMKLPTGTFPVQSIWSNSANGGQGGCVSYYKNAKKQHG